MKKFFLLLCLVAFISCKPRNTQKTEQIDTSQEEIQQSEVKEELHSKTDDKSEKNKTICYMYVNTIGGIVLRSDPDEKSYNIKSLLYKEKVQVVSRETQSVTISGVTSNWYRVRTEDDLMGYVLGAFLESNKEDLDFIEKYTGDFYLNEESDKPIISIKYLGTGEVSITAKPLHLNEQTENKSIYTILSSDEVFKCDLDGTATIQHNFYIKDDKLNYDYYYGKRREDDDGNLYYDETSKNYVLVKKSKNHLLNYFIDNFTGEFAKENEPQKTVAVINQISDDIFHINLTWKNFVGQYHEYGGDFSFSAVQDKNKVYEYSAEGGFSQTYFKLYLEDEKLMCKVACYKAYLDDDEMNITEEYREDEVYTLIKIK